MGLESSRVQLSQTLVVHSSNIRYITANPSNMFIDREGEGSSIKGRFSYSWFGTFCYSRKTYPAERK